MSLSPSGKSDFKVVCGGIRGSYPVCGKNYLKYGGNTTSFEVRCGECLIIVDAGTGIINLGRDLVENYMRSGTDAASRTPVEAILLFSHVHFDHTQGLPFFAPIFMPDSIFYIYGPCTSNFTFEEAITSTLRQPFYPISMNDMYSLKLFRPISQAESIFWSARKGIPTVVHNHRERERRKLAEENSEITISCMKSYAHPNEGVLIYRIEYNGKTVVFASDTEGYVFGDTRLIQFSRGADLLLHDAGYTKDVYRSRDNNKQGFGHSTAEMAAEVARKAKVKNLGLVHHDPCNDDSVIDAEEKRTQELFPESFAAREGQVINL